MKKNKFLVLIWMFLVICIIILIYVKLVKHKNETNIKIDNMIENNTNNNTLIMEANYNIDSKEFVEDPSIKIVNETIPKIDRSNQVINITENTISSEEELNIYDDIEKTSETENSNNSLVSSLTLNEIPINIDENVSSKYNIAYMLHYKISVPLEVDSEEEKKINDFLIENIPNNTGLWFSEKGLQGLETSISSKERAKAFFDATNVDCIIKDGFVQTMNSNIEMCEYANKIIMSSKTVMIAFSPIYYAFINNEQEDFINQGISRKIVDFEMDGKKYIKLENFENIYPYIINENCTLEEFTNILKDICNDLELQ